MTASVTWRPCRATSGTNQPYRGGDRVLTPPAISRKRRGRSVVEMGDASAAIAAGTMAAGTIASGAIAAGFLVDPMTMIAESDHVVRRRSGTIGAWTSSRRIAATAVRETHGANTSAAGRCVTDSMRRLTLMSTGARRRLRRDGWRGAAVGARAPGDTRPGRWATSGPPFVGRALRRRRRRPQCGTCRDLSSGAAIGVPGALPHRLAPEGTRAAVAGLDGDPRSRLPRPASRGSPLSSCRSPPRRGSGVIPSPLPTNLRPATCPALSRAPDASRRRRSSGPGQRRVA